MGGIEAVGTAVALFGYYVICLGGGFAGGFAGAATATCYKRRREK